MGMNVFEGEMSWKRRLAIVLSFLWLAVFAAIGASERNGFAIFVALGLFPVAALWGIGWVWSAYRKQKRPNESIPSRRHESVGTESPTTLQREQSFDMQPPQSLGEPVRREQVREEELPDAISPTEQRNTTDFPKTRWMNVFGAVGWGIVGVMLFFNKVDEQPAGVLAGITLMYLVLASIPVGTAFALSTSASARLRTSMMWSNWALIGLWCLGTVGAIYIPKTLTAAQLWGAVGGALVFVLPQWINIRALRSDLPMQRSLDTNVTTGSRWLYGGFVVTSLVGLALYVGLVIRSVITNGNVAYAAGATLIPALIAYAAISNRESHGKNRNLGLVAGIVISLAICGGGVNTWNNIITAQVIAEVAQKHLDESKRFLEQSGNPTSTTVSGNTDKPIAQPTTPTPSRSLTKSEQLEFFSIFMGEVTERQARRHRAYREELARINLDAMWEPSNLFSVQGLRQNQQKIAAYMELIDVMQNDYYGEIKLQDDRVLSAAGPAILNDVRQGRASNNDDTLALYALERGNMDNAKRLFSFLENQLRQGTAAFQDGQPLFASESDVETYNSLINRVTTTQKQIEELQKKSILSRQQGIEKIKAAGDRN